MKSELFEIADARFLKYIDFFKRAGEIYRNNEKAFILGILAFVSITAFVFFSLNGLALAYNDARSHLDIGRRVVEGMKTGLAQLGSVWLPLPHFLMIFTVWNDFMWHSGFSGAIISMVSYVGVGFYIYLILKKLGVGIIGRLAGVLVFAANGDILYLQSTAMTELLLLLTWSGAFYELISWFKTDEVWNLVKASLWIILSTLTRYEGWFIFLVVLFLVTFRAYKNRGYKVAEGIFVLFGSLAGIGIILWILWNYLIFGDPLYSFIGPYSAHAQQQQIYEAGELITKWNMLASVRVYSLANYYTIGFFYLILAILGMFFLIFNKKLNIVFRFSISMLLLSPYIFNVLALFFGFSIISIPSVFGGNWFNVRYGVMMSLSVAILSGYLVQQLNFALSKLILTAMIIVVFVLTSLYTIPVTIQDALWGASSKNVSQVSSWLKTNAKFNKDKIFISAGSHDAIIFSSSLKMSRFIHEGTGEFWIQAGKYPDRYARYIVMRTYDLKDATFYSLKENSTLLKYDLVLKGEFADVYELKSEYLPNLANPNAKSVGVGRSNNGNFELFGTGGDSLERARRIGVFWITVMFLLIVISFFGIKLRRRHKLMGRNVDGMFGFNLTSLREIRKEALF